MSPKTSASPWQPLTFGGVAAFARASWTRLLLTQAAGAALVSGVLVWFFVSAWFPVIEAAVRQVPAEAGLRDNRVVWSGPSPVLLGQTPFLALAVNSTGTRSPGSTAHLEILFTPRTVRVSSLLGYWALPYLGGFNWSFNQQQASAWWDAWRRPLIAGLFGGFLSGQLLLGWLAALVGGVPVRTIARVLNRPLPPRGAWRLAVAALSPPALIAAATILLYGLSRLDVVGLLLGLLFQAVVGGVYLVGAALALPRGTGRGAGANPFGDGAARRRTRANPFGRG